MRLLRLGGQYDISNESDYGARHDVIPTVPGLVTVPRLSPNDDPADQVGSNGKSLGIDRTIPKAFDYLRRRKQGGRRQMTRKTKRLTVGKK